MKDEEEFKSLGSSSKCVRLLCSSDDVLNHILSEVRDIKTCMSSRLTSLELKVSLLVQTCNKISSRLDTIEKNGSKDNVDKVQSNSCRDLNSRDAVPLTKHSGVGHEKESKTPSKLKVVPISSEADFPHGSWLGDPKSLTKRVRCNIPPQNLLHINSTCFTPEKMALALLDSLFSRDELAISNISGRSRWGKKQLNPLMIFGIKCHLQYKFFTTDKEWHKICQNMDAKCRFAWKRSRRLNHSHSKLKLKVRHNMSLKEKGCSAPSSEEMNFDFDNLNHSTIDFNSCVKVITQTPCELRIVNATPAQIAHLQESQEIILTEEMLPDLNDEKSIMISNSSEVSMNTVVMNGDDGELESDLTINPASHDSLGEPMDDSSKDDQSAHHGNHLRRIKDDDSLTMHDSQLEEGLQLKVDLEQETEVDEDEDE